MHTSRQFHCFAVREWNYHGLDKVSYNRLLGAMVGFAALDGPVDICQLSSKSENVEMCVERSQ